VQGWPTAQSFRPSPARSGVAAALSIKSTIFAQSDGKPSRIPLRARLTVLEPISAASRLPGGTTVQALRISDPPRLFRVPGEETSRLLEIDVHSETGDATCIFICKTEPSQKSV
jgi:hypothetical protein